MLLYFMNIQRDRIHKEGRGREKREGETDGIPISIALYPISIV